MHRALLLVLSPLSPIIIASAHSSIRSLGRCRITVPRRGDIVRTTTTTTTTTSTSRGWGPTRTRSSTTSTPRTAFVVRPPRDSSTQFRAMASSETGGDDGNRAVGSTSQFRYIDVGANLLDERFTKGVYRGTFRHEPDLSEVVDRARRAGVERILLTAGTLEESREAVRAVRHFRQRFPHMHWGCTVGVHPTRCQQEFVNAADSSSPTMDRGEEVLQQLLEVALDGMSDGSVKAIGEIGLDYDRLEFTTKDVQHRYLVRQLHVLAKSTGLPLFLHNRSAQSDLHDLLVEHKHCWSGNDRLYGGVVHSFDDSHELALRFIDLGFMIGINGCSLKTPDNLDVVSKLPLDRILLETDCPYCEIRPTHAGHKHVRTIFAAKAEKKFELGCCVKNRQEPCHIVQVAEIVAGAREMSVADVARACYDNTLRVFYSDEGASAIPTETGDVPSTRPEARR